MVESYRRADAVSDGRTKSHFKYLFLLQLLLEWVTSPAMVNINHFDNFNIIPGSYSACPMKNRLFLSPTNSETISSISSWEACATKCNEKSSCLFWDWRDSNHATPDTCVLNEGFDRSADELNTIAGSRDCKGRNE